MSARSERSEPRSANDGVMVSARSERSEPRSAIDGVMVSARSERSEPRSAIDGVMVSARSKRSEPGRGRRAGTQRRAVLATGGALAAGCAAAALGGCAAYGTETGAPAAGGAAPAGGGAPAGTAGGTAGRLAALDELEIGGGRVLADRQLVLTRPDRETVKAFSAVCTHAGCTVSEVRDGTINCPCHGSRFHVADGSVAQGPATRALTPVPVRVDGGAVVAG